MAKDPLNYRMPFGKHKGKPLRILPWKFLIFMRDGFAGIEEFQELKAALPAAIRNAEVNGVDSNLEAVADRLLNGDISSHEASELVDDESEEFDPFNDMMDDFI